MIIGNRKLEWRIRPLMKLHRIDSVLELKRRLRAIDPESVSTTRLSQMVDRMPGRLTMKTLLGLLEVFDCEIQDLVRVTKINHRNTNV